MRISGMKRCSDNSLSKHDQARSEKVEEESVFANNDCFGIPGQKVKGPESLEVKPREPTAVAA